MPTIQHTKSNALPSSIAYVSFFLSNWLSFCNRNWLNNACLLTPSMHKVVNRNKSLKNSRNSNVFIDRFSNFMPPIKYISSHWLQFHIIYPVH